MNFRTLGMAAVLTAAACGGTGTLFGQQPSAWTDPFPAHRVAGNVYYVGSRGLACYLITTPRGHILLNSGIESTVPQIRAGVEKLGFKFSDIRILLISHAHWDHCAGSAKVKELTGARYMVMQQDVAEIESGGQHDFYYGTVLESHYQPAKVDRVLHDGDKVKLGDVALTAHLTPGHTRGCTTWTMKVRDGAASYDVVVVGSVGMMGFPVSNHTLDTQHMAPFQLVSNPGYPAIADDYARAFRVLRSLACDIFLGAHGDYYGLEQKFARVKPDGPNPFVDGEGYRRYVDSGEKAFQAELARQRK